MSAGSKSFGNFEILSLLGKGGMAEVYRARVLKGPREGWHVALKRISGELIKDPQAIEAFASEADLSRLLDHPNIVKVYEVGVINEIYFMVMELVEGRDVGQILRRCQQREIAWPIDFAVYLTRVLCDALYYAHGAKSPSGTALGIVHCDVSPSNLFVSRTGDIKLGDFGVARARPLNPVGDSAVGGKPFYLSPEALAGEVTIEADLWAATVTLYELLTLERPFHGTTPDEVFSAIRARRYKPVRSLRPEVPEGLAKVVDRGFSAKTANRFPNAKAMGEAIAPYYDERVGTPLAISAMVRGLFGP